MRRINYTYLIFMILVFVLQSCKRRDLTYVFTPTVEVVVTVDWSDMSEMPDDMSLYCYPADGGSPTIKYYNISSTTIDSENPMKNSVTISLGVGRYNILVFNETQLMWGSVSFSGLESFETAEVMAVETVSKWYATKSEETLVSDPGELAAATLVDLEIPESAVESMMILYDDYEAYVTKVEDDASQAKDSYMTIDLTAQVVVKTTRVTVELDKIYNLYSNYVRATLYGMSTGYNFSEQRSHSEYATHLLESWSKVEYEDDSDGGYVVTYFDCFGLPETTTETRNVSSTWAGTLHLELMLVDQATIFEADFDLRENTTLNNDLRSDGDEESLFDDYDDSDVDISVDITDKLTLPDVVPAGSSSGGFSPDVNDWGDEITVQLPA